MIQRVLLIVAPLLLFSPRATESFAVPTPVVEAWDSYNAALVASPLVVKSVTASVILGAADLSGQAIESARDEKEEKLEDSSIDWARAARFAFFGLVLQAVRPYLSTKAQGNLKTVKELFPFTHTPILYVAK